MNAAGLTGVLLQEDREVAHAYLVDATPSAVLVTGGRIASHVVAGDEAIRSLVADATRPKPYAKATWCCPSSWPTSKAVPWISRNSGDTRHCCCSGTRVRLLPWLARRCEVVGAASRPNRELADLIVISKGDEASR